MPDPTEVIRLELVLTPRQARLVSGGWTLMMGFGMGVLGVSFRKAPDQKGALEEMLVDWNAGMETEEVAQLAERFGTLSGVAWSEKR